MIERYSRKEAAQIWSEEHKVQTWLAVELAACEAWAHAGKIPAAALKTIQQKARFDLKRIAEIEATVKHDVIAFLTSVNEAVGPEGRYIHMGMTSSDVLDTALACQLKEAAELIEAGVQRLLGALKKRALEHKATPMIGRSHGIHAEPTTMGLKFALWYAEFQRNAERLREARRQIAVGKISGAVGTYAHISPAIEAAVCRKLGLEPESIATQVVQRDRHAHFFTTLAVIAGSIEKVAVEIRHLQRTEVLEAEEPFTPGQKGSSAMPHKRNPILSENLTGLARLVRANAAAALENIALWHERDISHSSVERVIAPDSCILIDFMLHRLTGLVEGLVVYPEQMAKNLGLTRGLIFSQPVLLALIEKGMSREEAYALVQKYAMEVWQKGEDFQRLLAGDVAVKRCLPAAELKSLFDVKRYLTQVDAIFKRVFN